MEDFLSKVQKKTADAKNKQREKYAKHLSEEEAKFQAKKQRVFDSIPQKIQLLESEISAAAGRGENSIHHLVNIQQSYRERDEIDFPYMEEIINHFKAYGFDGEVEQNHTIEYGSDGGFPGPVENYINIRW